MSFVANVKSILLILALMLSGFFGTLITTLILSPLFFLKHPLFREGMDLALGSWCCFVSGLLELFLGVKVKVTGDVIQHGERCLIMMNHRTRLDWMYFWSVLVRQSGTATEKIILKAPLKKMPGFGWAMQVCSFIFIKRKWEEDKKIFSKLLDYFIAMKHKTQLLLFPEGTDLTERTRAKSDEFARKNNVEPYNYVLHPRTTGFTFLTQYMRQRGHLDAVYDVTVAYPQNIPQKETDLLVGNFPREVHFHIKRHIVQSLPISEEGLANWCKARWGEKEKRLERFYQDKAFEDTDSELSTRSNGKSQVVNSQGDTASDSHSLQISRAQSEKKARLVMQIMTVAWIVFIVVISAILYASSMARWLVLAEVCMFVIVTEKYGGFEFAQADYYHWFYRNTTTKAKKVG